MGTFVTQETTPVLFAGGAKVAADLRAPQGLSNVNLPRADDLNNINNALLDLRSQIRDGRFNIRNYGGVCDGVTDDTQAILDAIEAATPSASNGCYVIIPGRSVVSETILIDSVQGLSLIGSGMYQSGLLWNGTLGDPIIRIRNSQNVTVQFMELRGSPGAKKPSSCIESLMETSGGYTFVSTGNVYRQLLLGGGIPNVADSADYGIRHIKNGSDFNNSEGHFDRVQVTGITEDCFSFEHAQSKAHTFIDCATVGGKSAVSTVDGGSFRWFGGNVSGHTVAAFDLGAPNDAILISGLLSESCLRMLKTSGSSQAPWSVKFDTCRMSADQCHADELFFKFSHKGTFHLSGCTMDSTGPLGEIPKVSLEWPAGENGLAIVENCNFLSSQSYTESPIVNAGANGRIIERSNSFNNIDGVAIRRLEQGTLTVSAGATTAAVAFDVPTHDTRYRILPTPVTVSGGATAGSSRVRSIAKTTTGFTITVEAAPGGAESVVFDWSLQW